MMVDVVQDGVYLLGSSRSHTAEEEQAAADRRCNDFCSIRQLLNSSLNQDDWSGIFGCLEGSSVIEPQDLKFQVRVCIQSNMLSSMNSFS